jgi:hypothetical protein
MMLISFGVATVLFVVCILGIVAVILLGAIIFRLRSMGEEISQTMRYAQDARGYAEGTGAAAKTLLLSGPDLDKRITAQLKNLQIAAETGAGFSEKTFGAVNELENHLKRLTETREIVQPCAECGGTGSVSKFINPEIVTTIRKALAAKK